MDPIDLNPLIPPDVARILERTPQLARAYLVGGWVRDALLGRPLEDVDLEVFGVGEQELAAALSRWGRVDAVGRSFGVLKLTTGERRRVDVTLPRRDSKVRPGHRGFVVEVDPGLEPREAAARRDFTINAMMWDPRERRLLDFFGGRADLEARVLRHTSDAFAEDPLRVLRGMQLAGRFGLEAHPATLALARAIAPAHGELAGERVWGEWAKWAAHSVRPSAGLRLLRDSGWLAHYPELSDLEATPQDPAWHPEGDVWTHTCLALDALAARPDFAALPEADRVAYAFAVLLHDVGKPLVTREEERDGRRRIVSPGHEAAAEPRVASFLARIHAPAALRERVWPLVREHLVHLHGVSDRSVRRLARRLHPETIEGLARVIRADADGRPPRPGGDPDGLREILARAAALDVAARAPRPILRGRHLLARGLAPGPALGALLDEAFEAQLNGAFDDLAGAERWLAERLAAGA
uniref:Polynucleotide adenylyltransferase n=1 Tax=Eiseniibacteriota bacterium TaxID=2212470 RepID=A0A832MM75_UNCEI